MKLQTTVDIKSSEWQAPIDARWLLLGSCFSDEIGRKMDEHYLRVTSNPFGTLYNPLSIAQALQMTEMPELVEYGGLWHAMSHHGSFSFATREDTERAVQQSIDTMQTALREADTIIVTFGTAWVYEQMVNCKWSNGKCIVANCHKMPADLFTRRRLSVEEILAAWKPILKQYKDKRWVFTVSPIRHIKDGLHENQLSKAILLLAVDRLLSDSSSYFPSYEILLDELRDYRFYADDLVHPSTMAVECIWQRFAETYFSAETRKELLELHSLWLDRHHTLLHPDTPEAQHFLHHVEEKTKQLHQHYPWID